MIAFRTPKVFIVLFLALGLVVGLKATSVKILQTPLFPYFLQGQLRVCEDEPMSTVFEGSKKQRCYINSVVQMVKTYGIRSAAGALRIYLTKPAGQFLEGQRCHALSHEMGNAAARMGVNPRELLRECVGMCSGTGGTNPVQALDLGCMNGAAHTWVLLGSDISSVASKCDVSDVSQETREACFHGIGHGLSELYRGNLAIEVSECAKLPIERARFQCAHATFMEKQGLLTRDGIPADVISYCKTLLPEMQPSCFEFAGFMTYRQSDNIKHALDVCGFMEDTTMASLCRQRAGESLFFAKQEARAISSCIVPDLESSKDCVGGFVRASIDSVNDLHGLFALSTCAIVASEYQPFCYYEVGQILDARYGGDARQISCATVSDRSHYQACVSNAESL